MRKAIHSVTHLDLARDAESLFIKSFPALRPSRFSGTRKRSVPGRVHSVSQNVGSPELTSGVQSVFDSRHGRITDYVHLNPVRARLLRWEQKLRAYRRSSDGQYLKRPDQRGGMSGLPAAE
jgi:hypothetical protein